MIGLSLSLCVQDILKGKVREEDVQLLVTGTRINGPNAEPRLGSGSWDYAMREYGKSYWRENPELGIAIATRLVNAGKLFQPRQWNCDAELNIAHGHWACSNGWLLDRDFKAQVPCQNCQKRGHDTYNRLGEHCWLCKEDE